MYLLLIVCFLVYILSAFSHLNLQRFSIVNRRLFPINPGLERYLHNERKEDEVVFNKTKLLRIQGGFCGKSFSNHLAQDFAVSGLVLVETLIWLGLWSNVARKKILPSIVTRKIIHTGSAPLFLLHWPLFSRHPSARFVASCIPLFQTIRLIAAGLSGKKRSSISSEDSWSAITASATSEDLVLAVSRTGDNLEALGGPLIYSLVLLCGTSLFFRESPVGIVAICQMAAGDGLADIIGRRWGASKWSFSQSKSIIGTIAFVLGGFLCSSLCLHWLNYTGFHQYSLSSSWLKIFVISLCSGVVELFPIVDDNILVPIVAGLMTWLLFSSE